MYIKINENEVQLGGQVATQEMLDGGWFEYTGNIPSATHLAWDVTNKILIEDTVKILEEMASVGEKLAIKAVQDVIDTYNGVHGVKFKNIYSCSAYVSVATYTHQQFCIDVVSYNAAIWDASRSIQSDVIAGTIPAPTEDEFIALLPKYTGIV